MKSMHQHDTMEKRAAAPDASVNANDLRPLLQSTDEFALLDVREEGVFNQGHAFEAVSAPLSHLETRLPLLVPRKSTRIVIMDSGNEDLARRALDRMTAWGYRNVQVLAGGLSGWRDAGYPVFSGIYVPSKAFGEFVEEKYHTPDIDPEEVQSWMDTNKPFVILDSRPYEEFNRFSMPGAINCPGAELVSRVFDAVPSEDTTIVVSCAGRTRGIVGAQALINAGIPNRVFALRNGTQGWVLSGRNMERGNTRVAPPPTFRGLSRAVDAATKVVDRFGVEAIDAAALHAMRLDASRTLYVFDVRLPEEYRAGHLPGSRSAPGGQLVQSTDYYVGTRNARIVLCDDTGVRAKLTASWLLQLGWREVYVLRDGLAQPGTPLEYGPEPMHTLELASEGPPVSSISVAEVRDALGSGAIEVLDLASSLEYRRGHIPGAWFTVRSRLRDSLRLIDDKPLVVTSADGRFARIAAADVATASGRPVHWLDGGTDAWKKAGLPTLAGEERMASLPDDVWYSPYDVEDQRTAMMDYLKWEVELMRKLESKGASPFKYFPPGDKQAPADVKPTPELR
jgi:rhodanese-related sulfurtransferase